MRLLFDEYGDTILTVLVGSIIFSLLISFFLNSLLNINMSIVKDDLTAPELSSIVSPVNIKQFEVKDVLINIGEEFCLKDNVLALNTNDEDITSYVTIKEEVDFSKVLDNEVTYILRYNGVSKAIKGRLIIVDEKEVVDSSEEHV